MRDRMFSAEEIPSFAPPNSDVPSMLTVAAMGITNSSMNVLVNPGPIKALESHGESCGAVMRG